MAQEAQGDWLGALTMPAGALRLAIHIKKGPDGAYGGTLDSLDQGVKGLALAQVVSDAGALSFKAPAVGGRYQGRWDVKTERWVGTWTQGGAVLPLNLTHGVAEAAPIVSGLDGDWAGALQVGAAKLRLVLHVKTGSDGTTATLDSIDQASFGLPVSSVGRDGAKVRLEMKATRAVFEAVLAADGASMIGTWTQGGRPLPLTLSHQAPGTPQAKLERPQMPAPPFPYDEARVTFESHAASASLGGTLTLPRGAGPFPAVVLISGSGPNDRDETILGHKPFWVLADYLTRRGIAVLRYDKRGIGESGGDYAHATTLEFAADAVAAVAWLRTRRDIDGRKIGLIGHSEGGLIAPIVADQDPSVAFIVLLAAPGLDGEAILKLQDVLVARAAGVPAEKIAQNQAMNARIYAVVKSAKDEADAREKLRPLFAEAEAGAGLPAAALDAQAAAASSDWFRFFLTYDPLPALRGVRCPVLALAGSKDLQVPPAEDLPPLRQALAGNRDATVEELPGLNHLFQTAVTGGVGEYATIEETLSPVLLQTVTDWIERRFVAAPPERD
jgi:hypothetical protein